MENFVMFLEKFENSSKCATYLIAPFLSKTESFVEAIL